MAEEKADGRKRPPTLTMAMEKDLLRVAHMFAPYRDDRLMRELCRLAVKSVRERWIGD